MLYDLPKQTVSMKRLGALAESHSLTRLEPADIDGRRFSMKALTALMMSFALAYSLAPALAQYLSNATFTVSSRNGAYDASLDWHNIDGVATLSSSHSREIATVYLTNFDLTGIDPKSLATRELGAGQGMLFLGLNRQISGQEKVDLAPGSYDFGKAQGTAEQTGSIRIRVPGGKIVSFDKPFTEGGFELTEITDSKLCGRFTLRDRFSEISGTFSVPRR